MDSYLKNPLVLQIVKAVAILLVIFVMFGLTTCSKNHKC